jgi:hypothetical protein
MKAYGGMEVYLPPRILDLGSCMELSGRLQAPDVLSCRRSPYARWIGGWVGPRTGLGAV